jgi:Ca2+-transporting ATPase
MRQFLGGEAVDRLFEEGRNEELLASRIFSRVTPEQKLNLIDLYQQTGHVVAMTGDGVNDAPALKKADIGVAMGVRGTAVAKEAAAMVLQDDDFSTIVAAIGHGRAIFANIRKFVVYLLSCNISEVLVVSIATIAGAPLPLLPLQILFLNLVTDVFPALALGVGPGQTSLMKVKPRSTSERILMPRHWVEIGLYGIVMALVVLSAMAISMRYLDFERQQAVTVAFCTLALAQLWHVFNMRSDLARLVVNEITRNVWIWLALVLCLILILAAVYTPALYTVMQLHDPGYSGWLVIISGSLVPLVAAPVVRRIARGGFLAHG